MQAFSGIGDGDLSETILVDPAQENPLPYLLVASEDSIFLKDIDLNKNISLLLGINTPIEIAYSIKESKLFWINRLQDLMMSEMSSLNKTNILYLNKNTKSVTFDWLERSLYYIQTNEINSHSTIFKIDFNFQDKSPTKHKEILLRSSDIKKIQVSPYTKKLYWLENGKLMTSHVNGTGIQPFFTQIDLNHNAEICNCSSDIIVYTYALDHSSDTKPRLVYVDRNGNVVTSDPEGCFCDILANPDVTGAILPEHIQSDLGHLYWTSDEYLNILHEATKISKNGSLIENFVIYGPHMQPFPELRCLRPYQKMNQTIPVLKHKTPNSLTISLPEILMNPECFEKTSIATVEYRIYFTPYQQIFCGTSCNFTSTFDKEITLLNLKPFTKYMVAVSMSNFYSLEDQKLTIGPTQIFQTAIGAPSKPQNVSVQVLTPSVVKVSWSPPQEFNGATVHYEIYWKTEGTLSGVRQKEQPVVEQFSETKQFFTTLLNKLSPNETYTVWVRAYSETNDTSSDSDMVQVDTYPEPENLILTNRTAYSLEISWKISPFVDRFVLEYTSLTSNEWQAIPTKTNVQENTVQATATNLAPKTSYKFRLSLLYPKFTERYVWPGDSRFIWETLGDKPSPPGVPIIQYVKTNTYKVWWEASKDNGAPIELYMLEGLELLNYRTKRSTNRSVAYFHTAPSIDIKEETWIPFYNGTETSWIIDGLTEKYRYEFRVSALNAHGWSEPSERSTAFDLNEAARMAENQGPITQIIIATFIPFSVVMLLIVCWMCRKS